MSFSHDLNEECKRVQQQQEKKDEMTERSERNEADETSVASLWNSVDSGKFLSQEFFDQIPFLSKESTIPSDGSVFKSQDIFSKLFQGLDMNALNEASKDEAKVLETPEMLEDTEGTKKALSKVFLSQDWMQKETLGDYISVPYSKAIFDSSDSEPHDSKLPAVPSPESTCWTDLYRSQLHSHLSIPGTPDSGNEQDINKAIVGKMPVPEDLSALKKDKKTAPKKKRKRKPRKKVIPEVKHFVKPNENDVLLGRGGRSNHHAGNKRYREEVKNLRSWYLSNTDKDEKTRISQSLVDLVHAYEGRFLEEDKEVGGWYVVPNIVARRKASQALREDDDPDKRALKRARYLKKKAQNDAVAM